MRYKVVVKWSELSTKEYVFYDLEKAKEIALNAFNHGYTAMVIPVEDQEYHISIVHLVAG